MHRYRKNLKIRDASGQVIARFDLSYERRQILIEYDGRQHAASKRARGPVSRVGR